MPDQSPRSELDHALSQRLARLATVPVDTTALARRLGATMAAETPPATGWRLQRSWRPWAGLAAALALAATLGIVLLGTGGTPATAAPTDLARLHAETIRNASMAVTVSSVEEANRVLAGRWEDLPRIPAPSGGQLHACCIHDFMDSKVVCLILRDGQTPLTLVVGHAREFRPTQGRAVQRHGRTFTLHEVDGLRMAMTQQDTRFICLMGEVSESRLLELAQDLKF